MQLLICTALLVSYCGFVARLPNKALDTQIDEHVPIDAFYYAKVIDVSDGDSLTVRANHKSVKIRLAQIDAPEGRQPWGQKSRHELLELVAGKTVKVVPLSIDRYGRTVAALKVDNRDINQAMVARGAAWAYPDYLRDQTIVHLEERARALRQGLWAMPADQRVAPWEYRRQQRDNTDIVVGR